jgi:two-component system sensor histidine kinase KdpD
MRVSIPLRFLRLSLSIGLVVAIVTVCVFLPHVDATAVMLVLLLAVLVIASRWGLWEGIAAAGAGALLLDYFFLPPPGWGIEAPEHWVALATFVGIALVTGKLAERASAQTIKEMERRIESERLYTFARELAGEGSFQVIVAKAMDSLVRVFKLRAAAFYDVDADEVIHSWSLERAIPEDKLRLVARQNTVCTDKDLSINPILIEGRTIGSLGIRGDGVSQRLLDAVAERLEIGLAKARALEQLNEAEAVRKSQELASAVLDSLVHEIKTPLSVVKTAASSLLSRDLPSAARLDLAALISEEIDHFNVIINGTFWTAQVKSGTLLPEIRPYKIRHVVETSLEELNGKVKSRPIKIEIPDTLPPADCDFHMIKVVFKELMNNAVKYSPDGSPLTICAHLASSDIVTSVADCGIGIPQGEETRIFEKHYRGTTAVPGTGLGLAIAKTIVNAHHGDIGAVSQAGKGSTFYFSLPISRSLL